MEPAPTATAFIKSAWRWFKRNYANIMLTLVVLILFATLLEIAEYAWSDNYHLNQIEEHLLYIRYK